MCGIAGFVSRAPAPGVLGAMLERMRARGPDGEGTWLHRSGDWNVAIGHRRLAIIDVAAGAQPMTTEDGLHTITFNGEIYNFRELQEQLVELGLRFHTRSDTEVLLQSIRQHDVAGLPGLDGMFAFGVWDERRRRLLLARDRAGIKPLYYSRTSDGGLVFASDMRAVLLHPAVDGSLSPRGVLGYLFSDYAHAPTTVVRSIRKLEPGCFLEWTDGVLGGPKPYFHLELRGDGGRPSRATEARLAAELWDELGRAVKMQMVSDVPVGVFLSGGIDSTCITTLAAQHSPHRLKTFSIGFEERGFDESRYARLVADRLGTEHVTETLSSSSLLAAVDEALDTLDEPMADPSLVPTYVVSKLASQHVKVVLGGDGGDELWGGYATHQAHRVALVYSRLPASVQRWVAGAVEGLPVRDGYQPLEWKLKRFVHRWDVDASRRHLTWLAAADLPALRALMPDCAASPPTFDQMVPASADILNGILALDFLTYLPGSILTKVDRASMANSLEVRPPFLDNAIIDWSFGIPSSLKVRGMRSKALLKRAAGPHIPREVLVRKKKGFAMPVASLLRGPFRGRMDAAIRSCSTWSDGLLDQSAAERFAREHVSRVRDHSKLLWAMVVFAHWYHAVARRGPSSRISAVVERIAG